MMFKRLFFILSLMFLMPVWAGKVIKVVTSANFPPYEFHQNGQIVGVDIDIIREVLRRNGMEMVVEDMKFDSIIVAIQTGKGDIAASGLTVTEDRQREVDFSVAYVQAKQVIIVREDSDIAAPQDLQGRKIGVQSGTTGDTFVTENIGNPQRFDDASTAVAALKSGKLDAVVLDYEPARVHVARNAGLKLLDEPLTSEEYAFAVAKGNRELLEMINKTLQEMIADGTIENIRAKYEKVTDIEVAETDPDGSFKDDLYTVFVKNARWRYLCNGLKVTLLVAFFSVILGVSIGFFVAIIRSTADTTGKLKIANFLCKVYLMIIRGTPVVLQLLIIYFVVFGSMDVDKVLVAIIAFGINSGAYVAEIIRSGIMSIDRGQMEAGRSLGLSYSKTMILVILPQALKNVLPALGNEFIVLLKETSVCGFIALEDLTKGGDVIRSQTYNAFLPLIAVALIYLVLVMTFSFVLEKFEKRLKKNE